MNASRYVAGMNGLAVSSFLVPRWAKIGAASIVAVLLSLLVAPPLHWIWNLDPTDPALALTRFPGMIEQLNDPVGWDKAHAYDSVFFDNSLRWRLLVPIVGNSLGLSPQAYFTLPLFALGWMDLVCVHYSKAETFLGMCAAGTLVTTSWAYLWTLHQVCFFDPIYLGALVVFTFSPSRTFIAAACLLAPWCDERFLIALPMCAMARRVHSGSWDFLKLTIACVAPYVLARLSALVIGDSSVHRQLSLQTSQFGQYAGLILPGYFFTFKLGWVLICAAFWGVLRGLGTPALKLAFGLGSAVTVAVLALLAWDTTRTMALMLPFLVLGYQKQPKWAVWIAVLNLASPFAMAMWTDFNPTGLWW